MQFRLHLRLQTTIRILTEYIFDFNPASDQEGPELPTRRNRQGDTLMGRSLRDRVHEDMRDSYC